MPAFKKYLQPIFLIGFCDGLLPPPFLKATRFNIVPLHA
jgi:hypothetical protein